MIYFWFAVVLLCLVIFLGSQFALLFRSMRSLAQSVAFLSAIGAVISFVLFGLVSDYQDRRARELGFASAEDQRAAERTGVPNAADWQRRRAQTEAATAAQQEVARDAKQHDQNAKLAQEQAARHSSEQAQTKGAAPIKDETETAKAEMEIRRPADKSTNSTKDGAVESTKSGGSKPNVGTKCLRLSPSVIECIGENSKELWSIDVSTGTQRNRVHSVGELVKRGILQKYGAVNGRAALWVRPSFYQLDFSEKTRIALLIFWLQFGNGTSLTAPLFIYDSSSNEQIGTCAVSQTHEGVLSITLSM